MKSICFVSLNGYALFNPAGSAQLGGTEAQLFELAQELKKTGQFTMSYIVGDFGQADIEEYGGIRLYKSLSLRKTLITYLRGPFQLWRALHRAQADTYIASPAGPEIGLVALYCQLHHKKFIYRTASSVDCTDEKRKSFGLLGFLYTYGIKHASVIITQSEHDQANLKQYYGRKSVVIRNLVKVSHQAAGHTQASSDQDSPGIVWIGSARSVKQPEVFLHVARQLPNQQCTMIMSPSGDTRMWEETKAAAQRIPNLTFIGGVPFDQISRYLSHAKLLVGTSKYEGFPNVYLQAAAHGVPIISLNVNPDEFITKYNLGRVADNDPSLLVRQIQEVVEGDKLYEQLSLSGPEYIKQKHRPSIILSCWIDILS